MPQDFANSPAPTSPQTRRPVRAPRIALRGSIMAIIQLENRRQISARLHTLSVTGGLLETSAHVDERSKVALAFYIGNGQILTKAEMLFPMPSGTGYRQPFRFTGFGAGVRQTLELEIAAFLRETIPTREAAPAKAPAPIVQAAPIKPPAPAAPARAGQGSGLPLPRFFVDPR